jgi:hypothetical protein
VLDLLADLHDPLELVRALGRVGKRRGSGECLTATHHRVPEDDDVLRPPETRGDMNERLLR